eukprot:TRINITY_DN3737_c0_g6_i1.p1 TRINITY_DN3737_c0_g6~~TRINITY_DN3737_c0_g6_i1.p1  ORF type:complete len:370 (-),score=72.65 TRINITY_DN3737_c0_g6_i1:12-1121(-)
MFHNRYAFLFLVFFCVAFLVEVYFCGKSYYEILGVPRDSTTQQIKRAYRKLSLQFHPDKHQGNKEIEEKYQEITKAYSVLSDSDKRRTYDQYGEEGLQAKRGGGGDPFGFGDFFSWGFGGNKASQQQMKKGTDLEVELQVSLKDLYEGKILNILYKKQVLCPKCRGTGAKNADDVTDCTSCGGTGVRVVTQQLGPGFVSKTQTTCNVCDGKGKVVKSQCPFCKGTKTSVDEDTITVAIERGMPDGHKILFEQEGDEAPDSIPGNLYFKIVTAPHRRFRREGDNLYVSFQITLLEALIGFEKELIHLDGRKVILKRDEITKPGQVVQVNGEGMPQHEFPSQTGDLFVEFTFKMPNKLTSQQREGIIKILS